MNLSTSESASPTRGAWWADSEPCRRPVQLPLPTLSYESNLKVWKWRVKMVFKHNSLWRFLLRRVPSTNQPPEDAAVATYCAALLSSCISETILADVLTLSPESEVSEDPYVIYERAERMFKAVRMIRNRGSTELQDIVAGARRLTREDKRMVSNALDTVSESFSKIPDGIDGWRNLILITVLLVKRYDLANVTSAVRDIMNKAHDENELPVQRDFKKLAEELELIKGQK